MTEIPEPEGELYVNTTLYAMGLARAGWTGLGWDELSYGLERAEALAAEGLPSAADLAGMYAASRDRDAQEYGARSVEVS